MLVKQKASQNALLRTTYKSTDCTFVVLKSEIMAFSQLVLINCLLKIIRKFCILIFFV